MKLLYTKRSPYARKVRIIALEKKIDLQLIDEDLTKKSQLLLDANPLGKIPALVLDNGEAIFDSAVITQYLDGLNDHPILIPKSGSARVDALRWEAIGDGLTDVALAAYMEKVRHPKDFILTFVQAQEDTLGRTLLYLDNHVGKLKELSLASIAVVSGLGYVQFRLPHLVDIQKYSNLMAWFSEFSKRPSVSSTVPVI